MAMTTKTPEPASVRVRVLRAKFCIAGRPAEVGELVALVLHDARRLADAGHVEILDGKQA